MTESPPRGTPYTARRHTWLKAGEPLVCPNGHKLKHNAALMGHEIFVCQHQEPHQKGQCGARSYVMVMPGGRWYLCEVTPREMMLMRDSQMTADEVLAYLGGRAA